MLVPVRTTGSQPSQVFILLLSRYSLFLIVQLCSRNPDIFPPSKVLLYIDTHTHWGTCSRAALVLSRHCCAEGEDWGGFARRTGTTASTSWWGIRGDQCHTKVLFQRSHLTVGLLIEPVPVFTWAPYQSIWTWIQLNYFTSFFHQWRVLILNDHFGPKPRPICHICTVKAFTGLVQGS